MRGRILVVDDDRHMVHTLRDVLELSGWLTEGAHNGAEAVVASRAGTFDAVLMDIRMPDMDGVAALKAIRADHPEAKVILMTAFTAPELISEAQREGAMRVLPKPVSLPPLLDLLETLHRSSTILVVDDDPAFCSTLTDLLAQRGYAVIPARSLDDAVESMRRHRPAAVLLHLRLGDVAPAAAILALHRECPSVALILYSGQPAELSETAQAVPRGWIRAQLQKPFVVEHLTALIDDALTH